jgi:hypothetical protein
MLKDYSGTLIMTQGRNKLRTSKKKSYASAREIIPATRFIWQSIGAMLLVTLVIAVSSTIWYGLKVQVALDQIGSSRTTNNELRNKNSLLLVQREILLSQNKMEEAARKLGLRTPGESQLRYP